MDTPRLDLIAIARRERERLRRAEASAQEVLKRVAVKGSVAGDIAPAVPQAVALTPTARALICAGVQGSPETGSASR